VRAGAAETSLFITPGHRFRVVERLVTKFPSAESTLLMLVSAFAGHESIRAAYAHAIRERYRFFSYGDAMLLERANATAESAGSAAVGGFGVGRMRHPRRPRAGSRSGLG